MVGLVGDVGAVDVHLHLTYMVGTKQSIDERDSRNPLEVLPPVSPVSPTGRIEGDSAVVTFYAGFMTVQEIEVRFDTGPPSVLDYGSIVMQGSVARDDQTQSGVLVAAGRPRRLGVPGREFDVILKSAELGRQVQEVVLRDFSGAMVLEVAR